MTGGHRNGKNDISGQCSNNKDGTGGCGSNASLFYRNIMEIPPVYMILPGKSKEAVTKGREQIAA